MISLKFAKSLFGSNFIGPEEINLISSLINVGSLKNTPSIQFNESLLKKLSQDYILILGLDHDRKGNSLTINAMREYYGLNPFIKEPCFYNQDWYVKEDFATKTTLGNKWYLIKKDIVVKSRGEDPEVINKYLSKEKQFPSAVLTAYTFFLYYFLRNGEMLWKNDFIWCSDKDHNGDRIYTGRYIDSMGINNNGFNIHRHLHIRPIYGIAPAIEL